VRLGGWGGCNEGGDDRERSTVLKLMILLVTNTIREREKEKDGRIGPDRILK
jgi:hypothetical protein